MTIGIGALWDTSTHRKMTKSLLGSAGLGIFPRLSNRLTFGLVNQQTGSYDPTTELELIRFWNLYLGELAWYLIAQVNDSILSYYIIVFDLKRVKHRRFIPFMVYALVYLSISSNLVTLDTQIPWSEYVCTHTCPPFLSKPLLR